MDKRACVLVTGAGGAATPSMIRDLKAAGHRVVACDMDPYAAGFWEADAGYVIPAGGSLAFPEAMRRVCMAEGVQVVIPLVDEELLPCWDAELPGIMTPWRPFVELCLRKDLLMAALARDTGVSVPRTQPATEWDKWDEFPAILKPRTGRGSRGLAILRDRDHLAFVMMADTLRDQEKYILQPQIQGTEYTVSVVAWGNDTWAVVPKEIICKRGITRQAVTRDVRRIDCACRDIQDNLRADGPFNVQLILGQDGTPWIFEINPRYSTTTTLTVAAGCPEVTGLVAMALGGKWPGRGGEFKEGLVLVRGASDRFMSVTDYEAQKPRHA